MNSIKIIGGAVLFSAVAASCSVKKYSSPEIAFQASYRNDSINESGKLQNIAKIGYRDFFRDSTLVNLIGKALEQNNDMKVAVKQIEFASLNYTRSKWGNVPQVSLAAASGSINRPSDNSLNGLTASQFLGQKYIEDYSSSSSIGWEADIWGKISGAKEEALANFLQTQEAAGAVRTRLVSTVVQGYYNLLMLDKQLEITRENLSFADSTLTILRKQQELGMITSLAVQQQEITKDQLSKSIPMIESMASVQENALSILCGEMPDRVKRASTLDGVLVPENISAGVPSELLANRPDVRVQELEVRKRYASVHIAKMSMYPSLTITAQGGLNSLKASNWFQLPGSLFGLATGVIAQPLLNGRALKTRYEQSKVSAEQAELNFKQSVLLAAGEVSDALVQIEKLGEQQEISEGLVLKADAVVKNSLTLYKYNEANYLDVIVAQSNRLQASLELAAVKTQRLNAISTLYRALGGGTE